MFGFSDHMVTKGVGWNSIELNSTFLVADQIGWWMNNIDELDFWDPWGIQDGYVKIQFFYELKCGRI